MVVMVGRTLPAHPLLLLCSTMYRALDQVPTVQYPELPTQNDRQSLNIESWASQLCPSLHTEAKPRLR